jgi:hypothetical protein
MVITGLSGRDLVGRQLYLGVRGYSLMAWTMLLLFFTAAVWTTRPIAAADSELR